MKLFIAAFALLAAVAAEPSGVTVPLVYSTAPVLAPLAAASPVSSQFHAQDELGQYSYGYSNIHSAKSEARSANGITVGGYSYVDPEGKLQSVEYSSDGNGFQVAASNLPVPPALPAVPELPLPVPVQDTPEVAEAKAKHLAAFEEFKVRSVKVSAVPTVTVATQYVPLTAAPVVGVRSFTGKEVNATSTQTGPIIETLSVAPSAEVKADVATATEVEAAPAPSPAPAPAPEAKTKATVEPVINSIPGSPAVTVKSFRSPALAFGSTPLLAGPVVAFIPQSGITAYSAPFTTTLFAGPITGVVQPSEAWAAAKKAKAGSD